MLGTSEQDAFVSRSVAALVTTLRADGSPASSMVSFARKGDSLYFSTTIHRLKGKTLARDPRASITIVNPHEPWSFVSVEGRVTIHKDNPLDLRDFCLDYWASHPDYAWSRAEVARLMANSGRAVFELKPSRVSGTVFPLPS
jgi:PPOX class probable F420-dependent enzyme